MSPHLHQTVWYAWQENEAWLVYIKEHLLKLQSSNDLCGPELDTQFLCLVPIFKSFLFIYVLDTLFFFLRSVCMLFGGINQNIPVENAQ